MSDIINLTQQNKYLIDIINTQIDNIPFNNFLKDYLNIFLSESIKIDWLNDYQRNIYNRIKLTLIDIGSKYHFQCIPIKDVIKLIGLEFNINKDILDNILNNDSILINNILLNKTFQKIIIGSPLEPYNKIHRDMIEKIDETHVIHHATPFTIVKLLKLLNEEHYNIKLKCKNDCCEIKKACCSMNNILNNDNSLMLTILRLFQTMYDIKFNNIERFDYDNFKNIYNTCFKLYKKYLSHYNKKYYDINIKYNLSQIDYIPCQLIENISPIIDINDYKNQLKEEFDKKINYIEKKYKNDLANLNKQINQQREMNTLLLNLLNKSSN